MNEVDAELLELAGRAQAVAVLDALSGGARRGADLRRSAGGRRREFTATLRLLAAYGVLRCVDAPGSWDASDPVARTYELTAVGEDLAARLDRLDVWTAVYEHYLHGDGGL
jgi:DNA-binding HxlR family transcriptional regulator